MLLSCAPWRGYLCVIVSMLMVRIDQGVNGFSICGYAYRGCWILIRHFWEGVDSISLQTGGIHIVPQDCALKQEHCACKHFLVV